MTHACSCIGPQNGEPRCPCMMRNVVQRDGRWIELERDLGPVHNIRRTFVKSTMSQALWSAENIDLDKPLSD